MRKGTSRGAHPAFTVFSEAGCENVGVMQTLRPSVGARRSAGFSLDDAANIRRMIAGGAAAECPQCGFPLEATVGSDGDRKLWLVRCHGCGRGLVILQAPA